MHTRLLALSVDFNCMCSIF